MVELPRGEGSPDAPIVCRIAGDVDVEAEAEVYARLTAVADRDVIVDLAAVTSIDVAGLYAIVSANRRANETGRSFVLRAPSPPVAELLVATGLDGAMILE